MPAIPNFPVDRIDRRRIDINHHITDTGNRIGRVTIGEHIRPAEIGHLNRFHA